jgi:hypothetical protein
MDASDAAVRELRAIKIILLIVVLVVAAWFVGHNIQESKARAEQDAEDWLDEIGTGSQDFYETDADAESGACRGATELQQRIRGC